MISAEKSTEEFYDALECRDPDARESDLMAALRQQIAFAKKKTPGAATIFADVEPSDITDRAALAKLPVTRKSDLVALQKNNPPFAGFAAVPAGEMAHLFASPGPIYEFKTSHKDYWRTARALHAAGFRQGDIAHNAFSYHLSPGGWMLDSGLRALGCAVIPAGIGNTDLQAQTIAQFHPAGYTGTPDFLKTLLDRGDELGFDCTSIKKATVSGAALPPSLRGALNERGVAVLQAYATADLGLIAYETFAPGGATSSSVVEGMVIDEHVIVEITDPVTGAPVPEGEIGEVVVTTLNPDYPLIRFGTGDLSANLVGPSPCGRTNMRIKGWLGRADQTTKVKGMFIHPVQISNVIRRHPEVNKARLVVDRKQDADVMTLYCECREANDGLADAIRQSIQAECKLKGAVAFAKPGDLPSDGKTIDDIRHYD